MNYKRMLKSGMARPYRNKNYLSYVKEQTCPCGAPADDPSHVNSYKGMGTKAPDIFCWPSCRRCHILYEEHREEWRDRFGSEWEWIALTFHKAIDDGVITL